MDITGFKTGQPMQLWVVTQPGGEVRRISNDLSNYISVDNRYVAFGDIRTEASNLWAHPAIGSGPEKQITHFTSGVVWNFKDSPDGKLVALSRGTNQSDAVLFTSTK
jgi:hypothetical protein